MFEIEFTASAVQDLRSFKKYEQNTILDGIERNLRHEPTQPTTNRFPLRPNATAEWELRIDGKFRVFYNVDQVIKVVEVQRIGEKQGNQIFFRGQKGNL